LKGKWEVRMKKPAKLGGFFVLGNGVPD
jgi:hypothetical protein